MIGERMRDKFRVVRPMLKIIGLLLLGFALLLFLEGRFSGILPAGLGQQDGSSGDTTGFDLQTTLLIGGVVITMLIAYFFISVVSSGDPYLYCIISLLFAIGLIMHYRLNPDQAVKHAVMYGIGLICFFFTYFIYGKLQFWSKIHWPYFAVSLILFLATLLFGKTIYGSRNWIVIAGVSIQPAELIRISYVMLISAFLTADYRKRDKADGNRTLNSVPLPDKVAAADRSQSSEKLRKLFGDPSVSGEPADKLHKAPPMNPFEREPAKSWLSVVSTMPESEWKRELLLIGLVYVHIGFLLLQRDWGFAVIFFAAFLVLYYAMGTKRVLLFGNVLIAAAAACLGYFLLSHIQVRVDIWRNPFQDPFGKGYQILQSLYAISWGGFMGTGIGLGSPELIPQVQHDFIFAAICEEMGTFGGIAVILLYFLLIYRCVKVSLAAAEPFQKAVTLGIATLFAIQTFVMIGGVIKLIPMTGVTLPFISTGGSSMVTSFIALGIIQSISAGAGPGREDPLTRINAARSRFARYNKRVVRVLVCFCVLFLSLAVYLTGFTAFLSKGEQYQTGGVRQARVEEKLLRGRITDRNGVELANSVLEDGKQRRVYPHGGLYAQVIGYHSAIYGKTRLEKSYNAYLSSSYNIDYSLTGVMDAILGDRKRGADLTLTIDHELQKLAAARLDGRNGAVVAINPKTGEILAMVSNPTFDPNTEVFHKSWTELVESPDAPLVARATMGLYSPGSTYKAVIAAAAAENKLTGETFEDKGEITINGRVFHNSQGKANGKIDVVKAFAVSSNVVFAELGVKLGEAELRDIADRFGINGKSMPFDLELTASRFNYGGSVSSGTGSGKGGGDARSGSGGSLGNGGSMGGSDNDGAEQSGISSVESGIEEAESGSVGDGDGDVTGNSTGGIESGTTGSSGTVRMNPEDMASVGIGQGKLQITPLQMALVAATIANDGVMMNPYLVSSADTRLGGLPSDVGLDTLLSELGLSGTTDDDMPVVRDAGAGEAEQSYVINLYRKNPTQVRRVLQADIAEEVQKMMIECVKTGTGKSAALENIVVAGKTGTAQNERTGSAGGQEHSWFIAFAPADDPKIAVAVLLEYNGESGGGACGPIARDIIAANLR